MGEAAHRLLKHTLSIKSNGTYAGITEDKSYQNALVNHTANRPRPAGPSGHEWGIHEQMNHRSSMYSNSGNRPRHAAPSGQGACIEVPGYSYSYAHQSPRGMVGDQKCSPAAYELQGNRQNLRAQFRNSNLEQYQHLRNGMSSLTVEGAVRPKPNATLSLRKPNSTQPYNTRHQIVQNIGPPPSPPTKWISRPHAGSSVMYRRQQDSSVAAGHDKQVQVKKVYQIKTRTTQNVPDAGSNDDVA